MSPGTAMPDPESPTPPAGHPLRRAGDVQTLLRMRFLVIPTGQRPVWQWWQRPGEAPSASYSSR